MLVGKMNIPGRRMEAHAQILKRDGVVIWRKAGKCYFSVTAIYQLPAVQVKPR